MRIGPYRVEAVVDGTFGLDGGSMFGVVPKPLWERTNPADERNRIELAARCLLIRGADRVILVDTGLGDKFDSKRAEIFKVGRPEGGLVGALARRGIAPADVTDVILTHLHFDHAGGTTVRRDGELQLTYPEATHHVQLRNWKWAHRPTDKDGGSYRDEDFAPLANGERLHLVEGAVELFEGIHVEVVDGHTAGMQMVRLRDDETTVLFVADLVPTRAHLRWPYIMAFDNEPLLTLTEKRQILPAAADLGWIVALEHDPGCAAVRLRCRGDAVVIDEELDI